MSAEVKKLSFRGGRRESGWKRSAEVISHRADLRDRFETEVIPHLMDMATGKKPSDKDQVEAAKVVAAHLGFVNSKKTKNKQGLSKSKAASNGSSGRTGKGFQGL